MKNCETCRHSQPYDAFLAEPVMCAAQTPRHMAAFMREKFGECGDEARLWEKMA